MEDQILKIFAENANDANNGQSSVIIDDEWSDVAREITSHVMEFIEWWMFGSHPFITWFDEKGQFITDEIEPKRWTIEEIYLYWLNNIKKQ